MGKLTAIFLGQWRAHWRRVNRVGYISTNNVGILIVLGGIAVFKYVQQLPLVAAQLAQGETHKYEMLLLVVFLAWLFPVMGESRRSISARALLHFPLTYGELFLIRLASVFISPLTWVIAVCSLALGYPLAKAPNPKTGITALLLYVLFALAISLTFTQLMGSAFLRKLLIGAMLAASVTLGIYCLVNEIGLAEVLARIMFGPNKLAALAAVSAQPFRALFILSSLTAAAICLSCGTFPRSLQPPQNLRSQRFTWLGWLEFPGRLGGLVKKDFRYFSRLLDLYLALPMVVLFSIYLATARVPSATAFRVVPMLLFLPCISIAFNYFGLDSPSGLNRYMLFPLSSRDILLSKNLAFALVMTSLFSLIFPFACWRFGPGVSILGYIEYVLVGLAFVSWGNWLSVKQPYKMQFYRLSSGGSPFDELAGVLFGIVPGVLTVYWLHNENYGAVWKVGVILFLYLALYYLSIRWAARLLAQRWENIRRAIV